MAAELTGELDEVADELYGTDLPRFTGRRNELARAARRDGRRELASAISALRKPTQSAWLLNQWIRRDPDGAEALVAVGVQLREAQRRGAADRMRELSQRRRTAVGAAALEVGTVAAELNVTLSPAVERQVIATLRAVIGDESVAEQLRRGRLVASAEYAGLGPPGLAVIGDREESAGLGEPHELDAEARPQTPGAAALLTQARAILAEAEQDALRAKREADAAAHTVAECDVKVAEVQATVTDMRAELLRAEHELVFLQRRATTAAQERTVAAQTLADAEAKLQQATTRLAELQGGGELEGGTS